MFKEYIAKDNETVFMNATELAESVNINGVTVTISQDNDRLVFRTQKEYDALIMGDILFFITDAEYAKIPLMKGPPTPQKTLSFNGKPCVIIDVKHSFGMYEVILQSTGR